MKHCIVITTSYPRPSADAPSGSEAAGAFVHDFCQRLSRKCAVTVMAPGRGKTAYRDGEVAVHTYWAPDEPLSHLQEINPGNALKIMKVLWSGYRVIDSLAKQQRMADLVLAMWALPSGLWARRLAAKIDARYAVWALGSDVWNLAKMPVVKNISKKILTESFINFADGCRLADDVSKLSGRRCEFLASARNIPIHESNEIPSQPYSLGYLGRWHRNKGIDLLLDALEKLDEQAWVNIRQVTIAGGGTLETLVRSRVSRLQERGRPVQISGYLDRDQAAAFLSATDIVLIPSRVESIPVILSDAVKRRCAIVSMPVGDIPLLNEAHHFGLVAHEVTSDSFAEKLAEIVREDLGRFLSNADTMMELFSIECTVNTFVKKAVI